jgi:putative acetyltransferase
VAIRYAKPADHAAISDVVIAAFGRPDEARLVEQLRADEDVLFELVADEDGELCGHILFSRLWADRFDLYGALAPLAVHPDRHRQGLGSKLVRSGLECAREFGCFGVLVLGDPAYYGRFGFAAETAEAIKSPYSGLPAFQALALEENAFDGAMSVAYPGAFAPP